MEERIFESCMGLRVSGGCQNGGCACAASSGEDREQSERTEIRSHKVGRRVLLFTELTGVHNV